MQQKASGKIGVLLVFAIAGALLFPPLWIVVALLIFAIIFDRKGKPTDVEIKSDAPTAPLRSAAREIKHTANQFAESLDKAIDDLSRSVEVAKQKQIALSDFSMGIHKETLLIDFAARHADSEKRLQEGSPAFRKIYESINEDFENASKQSKESPKEIRWDSGCDIIEPLPGDDPEIQNQIEKTYQGEMSRRHQRFADMKKRCEKDGDFAKHFCNKLIEIDCPIEIIQKCVPEPAHRAVLLDRLKESWVERK